MPPYPPTLSATAKHRYQLDSWPKQAMVVSARVEASKLDSDIIQKGGNVFDAMVATD